MGYRRPNSPHNETTVKLKTPAGLGYTRGHIVSFVPLFSFRHFILFFLYLHLLLSVIHLHPLYFPLIVSTRGFPAENDQADLELLADFHLL